MSINMGYMRVVDINRKADLEKQQEARDKLASNSHLQDYMKALRVAFRGIMFTPHPFDVRRVWVHMPKDPFCLGWIGYGDFQTTVSADKSSYVVYSKNIANWKYGDYNDQYHMAMSVNLNTAVRNAKKYLRPLSTSDMALEKYDEMITHSNKSKDKASNDAYNARGDMLRHSETKPNALVEYMRTLVNTGHEFTDKELEGTLLNYFKLEKESTELKHKVIKTVFVRVHERFGKQVFDVATVVKDGYRNKTESVVAYSKDDLPEDIMGKISALSMVENGHWVDDVGYRVDATLFYVVLAANE
tara:strand:- start:305 stop:1207 length:903 start_codon:yes stop_codon:yes gene_type:complete